MSSDSERQERLRELYPDLTPIDAATFQDPLVKLSETLTQKVRREGVGPGVPEWVLHDLFVLMRLAQQCFVYLVYMNADERRESDVAWREQYSVLALSSIRTLIDCLYNITVIIENPVEQGRKFRLGGLKKFLLNLEEEEARYGSRPEWQRHFQDRRRLLASILAQTGVNEAEFRAAKVWPTFGRYMSDCYGKDTPLQTFFRSLTIGSWSDYSALMHASFEGLLPNIAYFVADALPHDSRPELGVQFLPYITMHLCRAAGLLLCILTEVQTRFRYDREKTARIDERLRELWKALTVAAEPREFYDERYRALMVSVGINELEEMGRDAGRA
jgi:hypothetical protein